VRTLLTIAGFDPSNGAGITADLQTFAAHGFFGTSAITSLTVQSTLGVAATQAVDSALLRHTLDHLCADLPPAGVKIGMLGTSGNARAVGEFLQALSEQESGNLKLPIVFDPVLVSSSGAELYMPAELEILHKEMLSAVSWVTPNWSELALLSGVGVTSVDEAATAAEALNARHPHLNIVATGGDANPPTDLVRLSNGDVHLITGEHVDTSSTHGTGCAFASALLCRLVEGDEPLDAARTAKRFVAEAMRRAPAIGHGRGPLNLLWPLTQPS
jgi:hydroxymethylpyrimidine/phosphomethylpyrimidine kinase